MKIQYHTDKCVFLSYSPDHNGYRCMYSSGWIYITNSVVFRKKEFPFLSGFPSKANKAYSSSSSSLSKAPMLVEQKLVSPMSSPMVVQL